MKTTQMNYSLSVKEKSAKIKIDTLKNTYEFEGFFPHPSLNISKQYAWGIFKQKV